MKKHIFAVLVLIGLFGVVAGARGAMITIEGYAADKIEIVMPKEAPPEMITGTGTGEEVMGYFQIRAADELAHYLEQITGKKPSRSTGQPHAEPNVLRIWVGTAAVELPKNHTHRFDPELDAYIFEMQDRGLVLAGTGSTRGTYYAACDFLHQLGVRWLLPGPYGEHVPQSKQLVIDKTPGKQVPDFPIRMLQFDGYQGADIRPASWSLHNRLRNWEAGYYGHDKYVSDQGMKGHDEWMALFDGSRRKGQYCTSNPAFVAKAIEEQMERASSKGEQYITYGMMDNHYFCQCQTCRAMDTGDWEHTMGVPSVTDRLLNFKNQVAAAVAKKNPQAHLGIEAYLQMTAPPLREPVHPNLVITYAAISYDPWHSFGDPLSPHRVKAARDLKRWCELSDKVITYEWEPNIISQDMPNARVSIVARNVRFYKQIGVKGTNFEGWTSLNAFGSSPITSWARTRLLWDVTENPDDIMADYCHAAYGPAGPAALDYYTSLDNATDNTRIFSTEDWGYPMLYTDKLLDELEQYVGEGMAAIKDSDATEAQQKRFDILRLQFEYLRHYMAMRSAIDRMEYGKALVENIQGLALLAQIDQINPVGFVPGFSHSSRNDGVFTVKGWQSRIVDLMERTGGGPVPSTHTMTVKGETIATLPKHWRFRIPPKNVSPPEWTAADFNDSNWKRISTTMFWTYQWPGVYNGPAYYRTSVHIDEHWNGKTINFTNVGMFGEQDLYVNGQHVGHRDWNSVWWHNPNYSPWDVDITPAIKAGQDNQITLIVNSPTEWGGSTHRMFLWSPVE